MIQNGAAIMKNEIKIKGNRIFVKGVIFAKVINSSLTHDQVTVCVSEDTVDHSNFSTSSKPFPDADDHSSESSSD